MSTGNHIYWISHSLIRHFYIELLRGDVEGLNRIPRKGSCILASNHASHFDPPLVGCKIMRQMHFFARKTLWKPGIASWWLNAVETIPVDRDGESDVRALKLTIKALKNNGLLTLFPEGTRSKDGMLQNAKPGIGMIAAKTQSVVVPCRIFNSHKVLSRESKFPNLNISIHLKYGKPLYPSDYDPGKEAGKQRYQMIADSIMRAIGELKLPRQRIL